MPREIDDPVEKGGLFLIPGEIRNEVYRHLAVAGHVALLRSNRRVYLEMKHIVDKYALRTIVVEAGWVSAHRWGEPDAGLSGQRAQNWEFFWRFPCRPSQRPSRSGWEALRQWSAVAREECTVYLGGFGGLIQRAGGDELVPLGSLARFKTVVFRYDEWSCVEEAREPEVRMAFSFVQGKVGAFLGPGEVDCDNDSWHLTFRPSLRCGPQATDRWWKTVCFFHPVLWGKDG